MDFDKLCNAVTGLPGVEGLALMDAEGGLMWHTQPPVLRAPDPAELAQAVFGLLDATAWQANDLVLEFENNWLMLRRNGARLMLIVAAQPATVSSTRMMSGLLLRNLTAEALSAWQAQRVVPHGLHRDSERRPDRPAASASTRPRMYRGQPY